MGALLTALDINEAAQNNLSADVFDAETLITGLMNIYQKLPSNNNKKEVLATTIAETTRMMLLKVRQELEAPNQTIPTQPQQEPTNEGKYSLYINGEFVQNYVGEFGFTDILTERFRSTPWAGRGTKLPNGNYRLDIISGKVFVYGQEIPPRYKIPKDYGKDLMFELFLLNYQLEVRGRAGLSRLYITSNTNSNTYGLIENTSRISFALYDYTMFRDFAYPNFVSPSMESILEPATIAQEIDTLIKQYEQSNQQIQNVIQSHVSNTPPSTAVTHTPPIPTPPPTQPTPPMPSVTPPPVSVTTPTHTQPPSVDTGFYDETNYETWSTPQLQKEIEDIKGALELFEPSEPEYQELSYRLDLIEQILENRN